MYDPLIGRVLSPDNYVQDPSNAQSYNRYSYCLNNPLLYTDPSGEKWWHWLLIGLGADIFTGGALSTTVVLTAMAATTTAGLAGMSASITFAGTVGPIAVGSIGSATANSILGGFGALVSGDFKDIGNRMGNPWKLAWGLFVTDHNISFGQRAWQFVSRHTWEMPTTAVGYAAHSMFNIVGRSNVEYFNGATVMQTNWMNGGVTLGSNITISYTSGEINSDNTLLLHEYGHYLDGMRWGPIYLFAIGIPSIISASGSELITTWNGNEVSNPYRLYTHDVYWTERRANRRAAKYFLKYFGIDWETLYPTYPLSNPFK
jgi:hypothetical protein